MACIDAFLFAGKDLAALRPWINSFYSSGEGVSTNLKFRAAWQELMIPSAGKGQGVGSEPAKIQLKAVDSTQVCPYISCWDLTLSARALAERESHNSE
jgi:hypothetical protein